MPYILEYSIYQYRGNEEKARTWLCRFLKSEEEIEEIIKNCPYSNFLSFDGNKINIINNNNYKYESGK